MYKDLSLKEKAKVIREGVRLGLNSIDDIQSLYDEAISSQKENPIVTPYGQWKYPERDTIIPSNNITMDNVNYPVLGISDTGDTKVMMPWNDYKFRGSVVYEHPLIGNQYQLGGLAKPFSYGDIPDVRYQSGGNLSQKRIKLVEDYITPLEPFVQDNTYVVKNYPYYLLPEIQNKNKRLSDEEISNYYGSNIVWTMENPNHKGLNLDGTYSAYEDEAGFNFGPGLHAKSNNLDINKTYTKQELDSIASNLALNYMKQISQDLETMQDGRYAGARDTLSAGPLLTMLDIAYNVKPKNKGNMPQKWPNLTDSLINGNIEKAKENTYSGSTRRQKMRNQMIVYKPLEGITVHNEALGGNLFKKGGIYIKPENRGKFTALKKRTGHSASWFKAHGTPAQKKMATFELNARHWKHDAGGHLFQEDGRMFKAPQDDLTGRNILTSPILPPKSWYEQFTIPELELKKPQPLQPLEGTYGNKYSELVPMSDGTYINNPINKGLQQDWRTHTLEFAPFLAIGAGPAIGSTATWLASKPALYNLGRMTLGSEIGGRSVDLASQLFTGNTWGQNVGNVVEGATGWNPNNTMVGQFVTESLNPGYFGKEGLTSLAGLFSRFGKRKPKVLTVSNSNPQRGSYLLNSESNPFKSDTFINDDFKFLLEKMKQSQRDEIIDYMFTGKEPSQYITKYSLIEIPEKGIDFWETPITNETKRRFERQVFPRLFNDPDRIEDMKVLYGNNIEDIKQQMIDDIFSQKQYTVKPRTYETLEFEKGRTAGMNIEDKGVLLKDKKGNIDFAEGHELRHTTQRVIPRTENEEKFLSEAYKDVPNFYNTNYDMTREWETMNFDARKEILKKSNIVDPDIEIQNKIILNMPNDKFVNTIYTSDGYWRHYIDDLVDKSGIDGPREFVLEEMLKTPEFQQKIKVWKTAMMKVGTVSGAVAGLSKNKNKE